MEGLYSSSYFQDLQSLYQPFYDFTECTNYDWNHCHFIIINVLLGFYWSLIDSKSPLFSMILVSILADAVVWMVLIRPLISKTSSEVTNPLVTVPRIPITIVITVTFMVNRFSFSLPGSWYLFSVSLSFNCTLWSAKTVKSTLLCGQPEKQSPLYSVVSRDSKVHDSASSLFYLLLFTPWEFLISVLADVLSLEFEWQQFTSSLYDSSHYSGPCE